jgi:glycosyltransferase involved in cell wall biosynthesis
MSKIAVGLMVKNESHIIERCLNSILPLADIVIITDTGSTDDTVMKAALFLQQRGVSFKIYGEPFVDFSHNRNTVLRLAALEKTDYTFMIDADEVVIFEPTTDINKLKSELTKSFYEIRIDNGLSSYTLPRLTRSSLDIKYKGVVHEYLNTGLERGIINGFYIFQINDGDRRVNNIKVKQEIEMLNKALATETDKLLRSRYHFYLAQAYQTDGELRKAKQHYAYRIGAEGWQEEIFYSYYQIARILEFENNNECVEYYMRAFETDPRRAEPLTCLGTYLAAKGLHQFDSIIKDKLLGLPVPENALFLERDKYVVSQPN